MRNQNIEEDIYERGFGCFCDEICDTDIYICPNCTAVLEQNFPNDTYIQGYIYIKHKKLQKMLRILKYQYMYSVIIIEVVGLIVQNEINKIEYNNFAPPGHFSNAASSFPLIYIFIFYNVLFKLIDSFKTFAHLRWFMLEHSFLSRTGYLLFKNAVLIIPELFWVIPTYCVNYLYDRIKVGYCRYPKLNSNIVSSDLIKKWFNTYYPEEIHTYTGLLYKFFIFTLFFIIITDIFMMFMRYKVNCYNKEIDSMVKSDINTNFF